MTPPIRWIERAVLPAHDGSTGYYARILQYQTASGEWVDVPVGVE